MDARIAALKAGLRLTPDQEKNWPAFESAVRDMAKARAERWAMRQNEQPPADPVEWLQRRADALGKAAAGLKKLADAEGPLYKSLDDAQKHRFEVLAQGLRPHRYFAGWNRSGWNGGWGRDQNCGWRQPIWTEWYGLRPAHYSISGSWRCCSVSGVLIFVPGAFIHSHR